MTSRRNRALIIGAGIAAPVTALWLDRLGWDVVVVEKAPAFREDLVKVQRLATLRAASDPAGAASSITPPPAAGPARRLRFRTSAGQGFEPDPTRPASAYAQNRRVPRLLGSTRR